MHLNVLNRSKNSQEVSNLTKMKMTRFIQFTKFNMYSEWEETWLSSPWIIIKVFLYDIINWLIVIPIDADGRI